MLRHRPATLRQKPDPRSDTHRDRQVRSGQWCDPRRERQVTGIELRLTDFADEVENAKLATAFAGVATATSAKLGEPTARVACPPVQYRWSGAEATVGLEHVPPRCGCISGHQCAAGLR
ncbi:DUF6301 family protein [Nocardia fluminea]|uniref:DUF6301 family protein n=1 Tax=Nocardia fluminea TaxID=134984 RepID=UPI0039080932